MASGSNKYPRSKDALVLFQARLYREGKLHDYWDERAANKGAWGTGTTTASQIKRKYGYVSPADEIEQHETFINTRDIVNRRKQAMAEVHRNKGKSGLMKAFDLLENNAPSHKEVNWVQSHPKMMRAMHERLSKPDEYTPPKVTAADITSPSNGPCPSKAAWTMLLNWLANPNELQKHLISKQKDGAVKGADGTADAAGVVSDDLSSLKRIHDQFLESQKVTDA